MENKCIVADCLDFLKTLSDDCIDCVITSPPYAEQRKDSYNSIPESSYTEWFSVIGREIYRVLKPTGSFILNIKEHVSGGRRSTYLLETVLSLSKIFLWNETFIWNKVNPFPTGSKRRLKDGFEYCYMFTKTKSYKFFPENVLVKSTSRFLDSEKKRTNRGSHNTNNGSGMNMKCRYSSDMVRPSNVLNLSVDGRTINILPRFL